MSLRFGVLKESRFSKVINEVQLKNIWEMFWIFIGKGIVEKLKDSIGVEAKAKDMSSMFSVFMFNSLKLMLVNLV